MPGCARRYSQATKLTLENNESNSLYAFIADLNQLISLKKLTQLVVHTNDLSIITLIGLLRYLPNINSLTVPADILSLNLSKRLLKKITHLITDSRITKITIEKTSTFENVQTILDLCPQVEYLEMAIAEDKHFKPIFELLYSRHASNGCHFFFLCLNMQFSQSNEKIFKRIRSHYRHLVDGCLIQYSTSKQYFWW